MFSTKRFIAISVVLLAAAFGARAATPLVLGTTYAGALTVPGQTNMYTFTGAAGQRLFFDAQDSDTIQMHESLISPGGVLLYQNNDDYDAGPWVLGEPGTFSLVISGSGSTTGNYQFRLLDFSAAPTLSLGTIVTDQLSPPLACNIYQFKGTHGQRVNLQSVSYSTNQAQWQLVSPANVVLVTRQINQNLGTVTLPIDGSYCLMVMGTSPGVTPLTYQIQATDLSDSPVASSGFGAAHSGTVNANQTNSFTYAAPAGLPVFFDSLDTSGQSLVVDLLDPSGNAVFSVGEVSDAGPYVLPRSGTYTLNVRGPGGASGNFNFRLLDLSASPVLPLNSGVTNTLSAPFQMDVYQLSGTAGQRLYFDSLINNSINATIRLLGPDGQTLLSSSVNYDQGPVSLQYSGTYYFFVQSSVATGPTYQFELFDAGAQPALPLNTDFSSTLSGNASLLYTLAGTTGEQLYFYGKGVTGSGAYWTLYDARNTAVGSVNLSQDFELTLPYTCSYTLVIAGGSSSVSFTSQVSAFNYATNALTLGTAISNNIVAPGDQVIYTFSGSRGQRLYYDALSVYYPSITVTLVSPKGVALASSSASSDFGPLTLPESGTYQLVFDGSGHATGPIVFQLLDIEAQPALPLNIDQTGTLPANATQLFQLSGTVGEHLYFYAKSVSGGGASWILFDPENAYAGSASFSADFEMTLANSGLYVLAFTGAANPVTFSNQVNTFTYTTNALTLGTVVNSSISVPGSQVFYTFQGTIGQRLYFDSLSQDFVSISATLISPTGIPVASASAYSDFGPVTLPESGTYLLEFDGNGHTTGAINFQMLDIAAQPSLPLNTDLAGTLPANTTAIYQLAGAMGEQLYFNSKGVNGSVAYWQLYGPNNASVNNNYLSQDFEQILPFTGTYVLALQGGANTVTYSNQVNAFSFVTNALALSSVINTAVVHPGDQLFYTFNGVAGQRLFFNSRQTNFVNVQYSLFAPAGVNVLNGNVFSDSGLPITLTQTGPYMLVLSGSGHTTGNVAFNLLDLSAATPVTLGITITDALSDPSETRLYRFAGTTGQRVNLQSLGGSTKATWELIGPTDKVLGQNMDASQNIGTITLPVTGTYIIAVIGNGSPGLSVPYQWSLSDVSDAAVASSGFGTVHSGTIAANQTNSFTYTASAGLPVFFDSQDASGQNLVVDLIAPDGTTLYTFVEIADAGPFVLPRSGTYTVNVRGPNAASGNYSFRLLDLSASAALPFNTAMAGTLNNPFETDVFQFSNTAGEVFNYNALATDVNYPSVFVQMLNSAGQVIGANGDFQNNRGPFSIQYAGTTYFFVRNTRNVASPYSFQLQDVATEPVLALNVSVTNQLGSYAALTYRYAGTAGQQLFFHGQPNNPSGNWTVFDPNNNPLSGSGPGLVSDFEVTLPYDGTYALVVQPSGSAPGTEIFQVAGYSYFTNNYTLGTAATATIGQSGERHFYTFTGHLGQQLVYNALTNDPPSPNRITVQLLNPQGSPEGPIGGSAYVDRGPFTLQESGTFTLVVDGSSASTGAFAFQILDVSSQPTIPINSPVSKSLDVYAEQVYQYAGTAGQRLYFGGQSTNPSGTWYLYDPNNAFVSGTSLTGDFEVTLPMNGTYTLVLSSSSAAVGTEAFAVNDYSYITNAYTLGTPLFDSIKRPGERHFYSFLGAVGQRLIYNALTNDPASPSIITAALLNPEGVQEGPIGGRFSNNHGPFTLQQSGTYTLVIDGNTASVGAFAFELLDVSTQPALPIGTGVTNTLGVFPLEIYQFSGLPGQRMYFRGFSGNPSAYWTLYDPNNSQVSGSSLAGDFQVTLPIAGTYVLIIASYGTSAQQEIFAVNPFNAGEPLAINRAPVLTFITNQIVGAGVTVSFVAQATDPDNNVLTFSLDPGGPAGAVIDPTTGVFSWNPPITGLSSVTPVTVRVTDNGNPPLSAAQTLMMEVIAGPTMITVQRTSGVANVSWHSAPTKHYRLQYKNDLTDPTWQAVGSDVTATDLITIQADTSVGANAWRFYRIQSLDPTP